MDRALFIGIIFGVIMLFVGIWMNLVGTGVAPKTVVVNWPIP